MDEEVKREEEEKAFRLKTEELKRRDAEKTEKNRRKRMKKKQAKAGAVGKDAEMGEVPLDVAHSDGGGAEDKGDAEDIPQAGAHGLIIHDEDD
jgi:hypothetical protein